MISRVPSLNLFFAPAIAKIYFFLCLSPNKGIIIMLQQHLKFKKSIYEKIT